MNIYTDTAQSVLVAAFDGDVMIGASTAMPLSAEADYVKAPFQKAGLSIEKIYYFAESVLLKEYRGKGLGHQFFDQREFAAKKFGFPHTSFCAVNRPENHLLKPKEYRPLDEFWIKRGYNKRSDLISEFSWLDRGEVYETKKTMTYWMRTL